MENNNKKKIVLFFIGTILFISGCNNENASKVNETEAGQKYSYNKDSINGIPVDFYLENKNCSVIAKNYYYKIFIPSDNDSTVELLNLPLIQDTLLRPFYFWCLNKIIGEADGALMEYVGIPARRYIEEYPAEFLKNINSKNYQENKSNWVSAINYSGYYEDESADNKKEVAKNFVFNIKKNCTNCSNSALLEIIKIANECFEK